MTTFRIKHRDVYDRVWKDVPDAGQSLTVQGELLRAVEKLWDEAERNGNINWDDGHRTLLAYLRSHLLDGTLPDQRKQLKADLRDAGRYRRPVTEPEMWLRLIDAVCDWCIAHPEPIPRPIDPTLQR